MKTYRLIKEYPGHHIGEVLYLPSLEAQYYHWENETPHPIEREVVETYDTFFEEIIHNWEREEVIYFLNVDGEILDEPFHPARHGKLVYWGNAFKTFEEAQWFQHSLSKLMLGKECVVINKSELHPLFTALHNQDWDLVTKLIQQLLK